MRQRGPYIVIGILIGIIIMQRAGPVAHSDIHGPMRATSFRLMDAAGNNTAMLFQGPNGPILGFGGDTGGPTVVIGAPSGTGSGSALVALSDGPASVRLGVGAGMNEDANIHIHSVTLGGFFVARAGEPGQRVHLWVRDEVGGEVVTYRDGSGTGILPVADQPTSAKLSTWGEVKQQHEGQWSELWSDGSSDGSGDRRSDGPPPAPAARPMTDNLAEQAEQMLAAYRQRLQEQY